MITSGKSDERQINSNKIKIFMYIKIQMYQKEKYIYSAVQLASLGPNFFVFLILEKKYKTIYFIWMNLSVFYQIYQLL